MLSDNEEYKDYFKAFLNSKVDLCPYFRMQHVFKVTVLFNLRILLKKLSIESDLPHKAFVRQWIAWIRERLLFLYYFHREDANIEMLYFSPFKQCFKAYSPTSFCVPSTAGCDFIRTTLQSALFSEIQGKWAKHEMLLVWQGQSSTHKI